MSWLYLFIASIFEIGWPLGLKLADTTNHKFLWFLFAIIAMGLSGYFLFLAQKEIPIGTAYAIWTGLGMIGTFLLGIILFHDALSLIKFIGFIFILIGIIILKIY